MNDPQGACTLAAHWAPVDLYATIGDRVACFDATGTLRQCSPAYASALNRAMEDLLGMPLADLAAQAPGLLVHKLACMAHSGRRSTAAIEFDEHLARWAVTRLVPVDGGFLVVSADADAELVRQHQIARQVTQDEQTGLPNRTALREELSRIQAPFELLAIEVEHVARIAEALGQEAATLMMIGVADNIDAVLAGNERLFRTRPTEFVVLRSSTLAAPSRHAHGLLDAVRRPILAFGQSFMPQGTIGALAVSGQQPLEPTVLLRQLELASAAARKARDGQPLWFEPAMETSVRLDEILVGELRHGIEAGQLRPHFQPIHCITSRVVMGVEALIRWWHPALGLIEADDVMRLARGRGLATRVDQLALDCSIQAIAAWRQRDINLSVSVNFTSETLADPFLPEKIAGKCQAAGVEPAFIEVEVPETFLLADQGSGHSRLRALSRLGVRLSIDDFGSGTATTANLVGVPIDGVKIDLRAARRMSDEPDHRARAFRTMARMAQALGFSVVAKGVETAQEEELVRTQRIALVQGHHYSQAVALEDVADLVQGQSSVFSGFTSLSI